jgi:hypothetical protein
LLDELHATFTRYVAFPDRHSSVAVTLWTATTHFVPAFDCAPRLVATSPEKRCGKSRLLDIVAGTCHDPLVTVNATVAAIFRSLGGDHPPTLVIDEADTIFGSRKVAEQNEDFRALLNAGHQRGRPAVRCVGPNQTPTKFSTFCMAAIAGIGRLPDTITDRGVNIAMRRRASGESVAQFRSRRDGPKLATLRDRLAVWAALHLEAVRAAEPEMPVEDRAADTWEPLIAVADAAGGHWPTTARGACAALATGATEDDEDSGSLAIKLLVDIKQVFADRRATFLSSADLVAALRNVEESPWDDHGLNARKLAQRLRHFGIKPGRGGRNTVRGYALETFADAFGRYLRPQASTPSTIGCDQEQPVDGSESVDGSMCPHDLSVLTKNTLRPAHMDGRTLVDGCRDGTTHGGLFDESSADGEDRRCDCGNRLLGPDARAASKCKPCRDKSMAGYDARPAHSGCRQAAAPGDAQKPQEAPEQAAITGDAS